LFAGSLLAAIASPVWALEPTKQNHRRPRGRGDAHRRQREEPRRPDGEPRREVGHARARVLIPAGGQGLLPAAARRREQSYELHAVLLPRAGGLLDQPFFAIGRQNRTKQLSADGKQWFYGRPDKTERWPTGWSFFIDGDMHMLLDFSGSELIRYLGGTVQIDF
jgi:hypothetical protein